MNTSKLSKLQKWILTRASEGPDSFIDADRVRKPCLLMARVIHEFYGIDSFWTERAKKHGQYMENKKETIAEAAKKRPVRMGRQNFIGVDVRKQRVSVSRAFYSLLDRGLGNIVQGRAGWTAFVLWDEAIETVNALSDTEFVKNSDAEDFTNSRDFD
jgi:hypothetical protein